MVVHGEQWGIEMVDSEEGETEGGEEGRAAAAAFEEEDRRGRALMYELTPRKEKKRARERGRVRESKGQNFRRQRDEIRFYLPLGRAAILDGGWQFNCPVLSGTSGSAIMNKLATCRQERETSIVHFLKEACNYSAPRTSVPVNQRRCDDTMYREKGQISFIKYIS